MMKISLLLVIKKFIEHGGVMPIMGSVKLTCAANDNVRYL